MFTAPSDLVRAGQVDILRKENPMKTCDETKPRKITHFPTSLHTVNLVLELVASRGQLADADRAGHNDGKERLECQPRKIDLMDQMLS